jgi:hypothetical protein
MSVEYYARLEQARGPRPSPLARLRAATARYPHDDRLAALVAELRAGSEEFTQIWATNPVRAPGSTATC